MPTIADLFEVVNGVQVGDLDVRGFRDDSHTLPVLRPTKSFRKLVVGFADPATVDESKVFPDGSLVVSTNGEGSHSYSYVIPYRFVPNSDVAVLIPRASMSLGVKLFYSLAITQCRWRFSFARKPKGERLKSLSLLPVPRWAKTSKVPSIERRFRDTERIPENIPIERFRPIKEIFNIEYGNSYELNRLKRDPKGIAFVSRTSRNNGISGRVACTKDEPTPPGCISVALGGTNVLAAFLQSEPTYQGRDVAVLTPKTAMSVSEKLWYATAITHHRFRFGFDRQANRQLGDLLVPKCPKSLL